MALPLLPVPAGQRRMTGATDGHTESAEGVGCSGKRVMSKSNLRNWGHPWGRMSLLSRSGLGPSTGDGERERSREGGHWSQLPAPADFP